MKKSQLIINLKRSWKYARVHKRKFILFAIASLILTIIGSIVPAIMAFQVINLTQGLMSELLTISIVLLVIETFRNIVIFISNYIAQIFNRETLLLIVYDLLKETFAIKTKELDKKTSGIFIDRLNKDVREIPIIFESLYNNIIDVIANIGLFIAIFFINEYIFIFFMLSILFQGIIRKKRAEMRQVRNKEIKELDEKNTGFAAETIKGMRDIKALGSEKTMLQLAKNRLRESNDKRYKLTRKTLNYDLVIWFIADLYEFLFIMFGIFLISKSLITTTILIVVYTYRYRVYSLIEYSSSILERIKDFNLAANRVFEIIESNEFEKETFGTVKLEKVQGNFEFDNVTFRYNDIDIIKNMSFKIKANETIAFVGKSGSGKTTIFNLITKLYEINSGQILIDGIDINNLDKDSIRNNISLITQNPYIFNISIKENLRIAKEDATDEEIEEACKIAFLHDYILGLKDGYDTVVGEGGVTLSGGQRQRLAIARALIKKTEIILFDEATSALDNETQSHIQSAIKNMKSDYTILIIAHRLSTVLDSDRIILIEDGKVSAEGSHDYLLANNIAYKQLYEKEFN
jgi:ABC-type multidrug transport system fused ATPase/permease subunit